VAYIQFVKSREKLTLFGVFSLSKTLAGPHWYFPGDSGGPIILPGVTPEEDVQVGIVSWYVTCVDTYKKRMKCDIDFI
jgi:secreted trypsin-like serine protease